MSDFCAIAELLSRGRSAHHPVARQAGAVIDFSRFHAMAGAWYAACVAQPGKRWALYFEDTLEFAAALLGAWQANKVVYLPGDALPATLGSLRSQVDGFAGQLPPEYAPLTPVEGASRPPWHVLNAETTMLVVYTSGSNGAPVAIPKHLRQLDAEVATLARCWDALASDATVLGTVSHQHIYGLLFRVLWPLASGRPLHAERLLYPESMVDAMAQGPSVLIASPAHLKRLPDQLDWPSVQRAGLRAVFSSGGALSPEAAQECLRLTGQAPIEIYGSSETGGIAWRQRATESIVHWTPLPGVEVQVADDLLQVRSAHLPDTQWFASSDRVALQADGFELLGRSDRIVKIEEKRISLTALDAGLLASGCLEAVATFVLPGARSTLAVVATPNAKGWALLQQQGKSALNRLLRACVAGQVEASVLPRRWRYVWSLPVNSQGKTTQAALERCFDLRLPQATHITRSEQNAQVQIVVAKDLPQFEGHFPEAPILPGVTQVEWALYFGRMLFALPPVFLGLEALKFQRVIAPGSAVQLQLHFQRERGRLEFTLQSSAGQHATGRVVLGDTT